MRELQISACTSLSLSADGSMLAVGSHDNFIYLYNVSEQGRKYSRYGKCTVSQKTNCSLVNTCLPLLHPLVCSVCPKTLNLFIWTLCFQWEKCFFIMEVNYLDK